MQINFLAGTNYGSAPAWLGTVANQVAAFYDQLFTNNITIDVTLNWVGLPSGVLASNNLNGGPGGVTSSFSTVSNALESHATNGIQNGAYSYMPGGVSNVYVTPGDAMVLGLESNQTVDIWLSVNSAGSWIENGGAFDPFAAIAHEITETAMGRLSFFPSTSTPDVMDMFRFRSSGVHNLTPGNSTSAYFSVDDGGTVLGSWTNKTSAGDFGDWSAGPIPDDAFGGQGGGVAPISEVDIELMNVLGWHVDVVTSGVTSVISGGQTVSGYTVMNGGIFSVQSGAEADNTVYTDAQQFNDGVVGAASSGGAGGIGFIQNGGFESSAIVDGGSIEWVEGGGEAVYTTVRADGGIIDFGLTTHASVSGAASEEDVEGGGGSAYYTSVYSGATLSLHSGGVGFGNHIFNGGTEVVFGSALLDTVEPFGTQIISAGGLDDVSFVSGYQYVYGVASGDIVSGVTAFQYVENGGSAVSAVMEDVGYQYVYSGAQATGTVISATGAQLIYAGGYATGTVVSSGGAAYVSAGGTGDAFNVLAGGVVSGPGVLLDHNTVAGSAMGVTVGDAFHVDSLELTSGGYASGVTIIDIVDNVLIDAGARASGTVVSAYAYDTVFGSAIGTVVSSAGNEYVSSGGVTTDAVIKNGGAERLASGAIGDSLTVSAGGALDGPGVLIHHNTAAGTVSGVTVGDPYNVDSLELLAGGVASNVTVIITADSFTIDSGASATGTVLSANGYDNVYGSAAATTVSSGGTEYVYSGGVTSGATVKAGGRENLASGAVADSITVLAGGTLIGPGVLIDANFAAGAVDGVTVGDSSHVDSLDLQAGAVDSASRVVSNGTEYVAPGATASGTTVLAGGTQVLSAGGTDVGVTISAGGTLELANAVIPAGVTITAGVQTGGSLSGATLKSGAIVELLGATVTSGGVVTVSSGGLATDTTVSNGGVLSVRKGGQASGTTVSSGGNESIYAKGKSFGDTVASGGTQTVLSGGVASGTVVTSGGVQVLSAGGTDTNVTIDSGGTLELAGEVISSATVIAGPQAAETVSGATLLSGAILALIAAELLAGGSAVALGGLVESSTVSSGGNVYVSSGGVASKTVVSSDGNETVSSGGKSLSATVLNGGRETVSSGGVTSGAVISSGGFEYALSSGVASNTVVNNGGTLEVSAGGKAVGLTLSAGGQVNDFGLVTVSGTHTLYGALTGDGSIVRTGNGVLTLSGASPTFSGAAVISGGRIELAAANALGTGAVVFNTAAAAVLQIDAADAPAPGGVFANTLSNFSGAKDDVDLPSIPFVVGATATVSASKLVLTDGGNTYKFKLAGSVAGSYPVVNDGSGGTMIDPVDTRTATFLDALAGFAAPSAGAAAVSSGSVSSYVPAIQTGSTSGAH